jgi:hypothetical protein
MVVVVLLSTVSNWAKKLDYPKNSSFWRRDRLAMFLVDLQAPDRSSEKAIRPIGDMEDRMRVGHSQCGRLANRRLWHARLALLIACVTATISARADLPAPVRVRFVLVDRSNAHCPDQLQLRSAAVARLGYDPFVVSAATTLYATISRTTRGLRGEIRLEDPSRESPGTRQIESISGDCTELGKAMALAISIAIDPLRATETPSPAGGTGPGVGGTGPGGAPAGQTGEAGAGKGGDSGRAAQRPSGQPSDGATPSPQKDSNAGQGPDEREGDSGGDTEPDVGSGTKISIVMGDRYHWQLATGGFFTLGPEPEISGGGQVGVGLAGRAISLEIEGRADLPREASYGAGKISVSTILASFVVCGKLTSMALCGLARAGELHGTGRDYGVDTSGSSFLAMLGMRVSAEGVMSEPVRLRGTLDIDWVMTRNSFDVDHRPGWAVSSAAASVGVATVVRFR